MANKRNDAMYRAKCSYMDFLMYARFIQKGGDMVVSSEGFTWQDDNGYRVVIAQGKIVSAVRV